VRVRFSLAGLVVSLALLGVGAAVATACYAPQLFIAQGSAEAGGTVPFSIAGIDRGAAYRVTVDGATVASGTAGESGVQNAFTMPSCGSASRPVDVGGYVDHPEDGTATPISLSPSSGSGGSLECKVPAPVTEPAKAQQQSLDRKPKRAPRPVTVVKDAAEKERQHAAVSGAGVGAAPSDAVGSAPGSGDPRSGSGGESQSAEESSSVQNRVLDAVGSTTSVGPAEIPTAGLLLVALIFVVGTTLTAIVIYLLQTGPDPNAAIKAPAPLGPDPVDVELQEMIAEEMARQLLSDLDLPGAGDRLRLPG
jgi:hypothetical protein